MVKEFTFAEVVLPVPLNPCERIGEASKRLFPVTVILTSGDTCGSPYVVLTGHYLA
jgi:hypothetical protein